MSEVDIQIMTSSKKIYIGLLVAAVFAVSVGTYLIFFQPQTSEDAPADSYVVQNSHPSDRVPPAGFREYRSEYDGISFFYPEDLKVSRKEGGWSPTIIFENTDKAQGFQVYITAHEEEQITEERFKRDIPSGIRKDLVDVTVAGAYGAAFYSEDENLGETYEVWFIHNGYLYEITTLKSLDTWLQSILNTWQFI